MRQSLTVVLSSLVLVLVLVFVFIGFGDRADRDGGRGAFDRVTQTNVLRCGYVLSEPAFYKDLKTGEFRGFMKDIMEELGRKLQVKIVWAEEVTFGGMFAGLQARRYDAVCSGAWISGSRSRVAEFTVPYLFSYVGAVVRADDERFDHDLSLANAPHVVLSIHDGDITEEIASDFFPKAKTISISQSTDSQQSFLDLMSGKADMTFEEGTKTYLFSQKNPGKLKMLSPGKPLRVFPWGLAVAKGEFALASFLSGGLTEMLYSGTINMMVKKNQPFPKSYHYFTPPISDE